ncbi:MAG: hypothetical protein R3276_14570 [Marinobacter sp.]|nr:hypothetical protein [Marinobacter sp.]
MYDIKALQCDPPLANVAGDFSWIHERPALDHPARPSKTGASPARQVMMAGFCGLGSTLVTGLACLVPMVGIVLGVSGLGWLSQYTYLRLPATVLTVVCLFAGFTVLYRQRDRCPGSSSLRLAKTVFWTAVALAVVVNTTEYIVLPLLV